MFSAIGHRKMSKPRGLVKHWSLMTSNQTMVDRAWKMSELPLNQRVIFRVNKLIYQRVCIYILYIYIYQFMVNSELTNS